MMQKLSNPTFTSAQYLKGVGPQRIKRLNRLGIHTIRDFIYHFPTKYLDRTRIKNIAAVLDPSRRDDEEQTIQGEVLAINLRRTRRGKTILEVAVSDKTAVIYATWFNQPYLKNNFVKGQKLILSGRIKFYDKIQIVSPEYEIIKKDNHHPLHTASIVPCYPLTEGLNQRFMRRVLKTALQKYAPMMPEILDKSLCQRRGFVPLHQALRDIHFPRSQEAVSPARGRLVYEELFLLQLALVLKRARIKQSEVKYPLRISSELDKRIRTRIPFKLTPSQEKVIAEIKQDLHDRHPMNRLLQGDVGSGKTIVAVYTLLAAIGNNAQVALMAPTEILAEQHFQTISRLLAQPTPACRQADVRMTLLTSGLLAKERRERLNLIKQGKIDLVIGTHALIQEKVAFQRLALLIIDEQHKFGVLQRATLQAKGINPHILVMTATPIPRTLALTVFGELDVSTITELPPGRKPVQTVLRPGIKMVDAFDFIQQKVKQGRQVYFVYPLIEPSDKISLKSATEMAKYLKENIFPEFTVTLLHGGMTERKKDRVMDDFRKGKTNVLVSTVVIEVGIDVPNASIMVIDHAERYGLAQLHQLRGRIGRGPYNSFCLLFGDFTTPEAEDRLKIMEASNDGFRIAEEDLRIRGPGEFLGTRQSGFPEFKIANLARDFDTLKTARDDAFRLIRQDPSLTNHPLIKEMIVNLFPDTTDVS